MACNCGRNRSTATSRSTTASSPAGTYRVMVNGRKVYESTNESAAQAVADRFKAAPTLQVLAPGE